MAGLAGCSILGGGGGDEDNNSTATPTPKPDPVTDSIYRNIAVTGGQLEVTMADRAEGTVTRLSLVGPVTGGGDTAERDIYPGIEPTAPEPDNGDDGDEPTNATVNRGIGTDLQPREVPRRPVFKSIQLGDETDATFTLLREQFGPETNNYESGIYYLVALGDEGIIAQRRLSFVPIVTLLDATVGDSGQLGIKLKNTGTGPAYPAYGTVLGAENRNRGDASRLSGGNGIVADDFILPPTYEREFWLARRQQSAVDSPFSYPRTNASTGPDGEVDFDVEASAYCTGTGEYSHGLAVVLGLVTGGYVGTRFTVTLGGEPELIPGDPDDKVLCSSLRVTSSIPRRFKPVRWPGGRDVIFDDTETGGNRSTAQNGTGTEIETVTETETETGTASPTSTVVNGTAANGTAANTSSPVGRNRTGTTGTGEDTDTGSSNATANQTEN